MLNRFTFVSIPGCICFSSRYFINQPAFIEQMLVAVDSIYHCIVLALKEITTEHHRHPHKCM